MEGLSNYQKRSIWVVAEQDGWGLRDCTLEAIGEGRVLADSLKVHLVVVLIGAENRHLLDAAARQDVDEIHSIEHSLLGSYTTDGYVGVLVPLIRQANPRLVLLSHTPNGQDLAPRLAARLGWGLVTGCIWVKTSPLGDLRIVKPSYQDKIHTTYSCPGEGRLVISLRPGVVGINQPRSSRSPQVFHHQPDLNASMIRTQVLEIRPGDPSSLPLDEAELVAAGGRGVGSKENWQVIDELADVLGASSGGSRVALDLGYIPRQKMIGQTGQSIRPRLYIAAGISGASHHLGGVRAETLISINTDQSAPIMNQASLSVVGDLHKILPLLVEKLRKHQDEKTASQVQKAGNL